MVAEQAVLAIFPTTLSISYFNPKLTLYKYVSTDLSLHVELFQSK